MPDQREGPARSAAVAPAGETGNGAKPGSSATAQEAAAQLATMRAERDAAVAALDKRGRQVRRHERIRRAGVGLLVGLFSILLPVTVLVGWAHNTTLNTSGWVRAVGPIASDPAVTAAISTEVTNQLFTSLNAQDQIKGALPPRAEFLAGPITNGVKGYVQTAVNKVLQSSQFQTIWLAANRFAHQQLVDVLHGNSKALATTDGTVVLNLVPLVNATLQQIEPFVSGIVGKPVDLPTVSASDVPSAACEKIATALNRPLPKTCGQIPLFPSAKLDQARRLVQVFDRITLLLLVLTPVLAGLGVWLSRRRRRTLLQLTVGGTLGLVVARRVTWWLTDTLVNTGKPENKAARQAIVSQVTHAFFTISAWIIVGLAAVVVVALVTGPYPWARAIRRWVADVGRKAADLARATAGRARDEATVDWVRAHIGVLRVGGIVVAIVLMMLISVSWIGFLVIAALLAAYEVWLRRLEGPEHPSSPPSPPIATAPG